MTIPVLKLVPQSNSFRLDRPKFNPAERDADAQLLCDQAKTIGRGLDVLFHGTRHRSETGRIQQGRKETPLQIFFAESDMKGWRGLPGSSPSLEGPKGHGRIHP